MNKPQTAVCEVCHGRPKMDRSVCCEDCWYSGRYGRWFEQQAAMADPYALRRQRAIRDVELMQRRHSANGS